MRASTKRMISLLGTAALFIAALAVYATLLAPAYGGINKMRGELAAREQLFQSQSAIIEKVKDLVAQYQGTTKIQDTVSLTLPPEPAAASIVAQLNAIAGASGVALQSLSLQTQALRPSPGGALGARGLGVVEISTRLFGTYEGLKAFLDGVSTNIRLMDISDVRVEITNRNTPNALSYTLVINAYYQSE